VRLWEMVSIGYAAYVIVVLVVFGLWIIVSMNKYERRGKDANKN